MSNVKHVSSMEFAAEVLGSDVPVVVDFYASWCMPCQLLAPALDRLAGEYEGRLKFVKVDVDQEPFLAATHEVSGVPTLKIFSRGETVDTQVGLAPLRSLRAMLDRAALKAVAAASV